MQNKLLNPFRETSLYEFQIHLCKKFCIYSCNNGMCGLFFRRSELAFKPDGGGTFLAATLIFVKKYSIKHPGNLFPASSSCASLLTTKDLFHTWKKGSFQYFPVKRDETACKTRRFCNCKEVIMPFRMNRIHGFFRSLFL